MTTRSPPSTRTDCACEAEAELDAVLLEHLPSSSPTRGSSRAARRVGPTIVTLQPKRARNCESSTATTPPPMKTALFGISVSAVASRFVQ